MNFLPRRVITRWCEFPQTQKFSENGQYALCLLLPVLACVVRVVVVQLRPLRTNALFAGGRTSNQERTCDLIGNQFADKVARTKSTEKEYEVHSLRQEVLKTIVILNLQCCAIVCKIGTPYPADHDLAMYLLSAYLTLKCNSAIVRNSAVYIRYFSGHQSSRSVHNLPGNGLPMRKEGKSLACRGLETSGNLRLRTLNKLRFPRRERAQHASVNKDWRKCDLDAFEWTRNQTANSQLDQEMHYLIETRGIILKIGVLRLLSQLGNSIVEQLVSKIHIWLLLSITCSILIVLVRRWLKIHLGIVVYHGDLDSG